MTVPDEKLWEVSVQDFLIRHKMNPELVDYDCLFEYLAEMEKGLLTQGGNMLSMIPTYVSLDRPIHKGERVVAMDIGGTNFRVALVSSDATGHIQIENFQGGALPGANQQIDYNTFFDLLADRLKEELKDIRTICVSFAYSMEALPNLDGRIKGVSKGLSIRDIKGKLFGECLKEALSKIGFDHREVYVVNDTIATALAGIAEYGNCESYVGMVVGTGMNTSYIETTENIQKPLGRNDSETMLIDVESGGYGKQPRGDYDISFDQTTKSPGKQTIEKMISGAFLGPLVDHVLRMSKGDGLFSDSLYTSLEVMPALTTVELTKFLINDVDSDLLKTCPKNEDAAKLRALIELMVFRAAKLAALQAAGACIKSGKGRDPDFPICITAEGSTFYKLPGLKQGFENTLKDWLEVKHGVHTKVVQIEHAVLKGAAMVGMTR